MKYQEKKDLFSYLRDNAENKETNGLDNIIDFTNGESFYIDQLDDLREEYLALEIELEDYIEKNELDDINDYDKILDRFYHKKEYFHGNQAALIHFRDYALKKVNDLGNIDERDVKKFGINDTDDFFD